MYIFIYRKNDVKKMYNFVISFIFCYWGKAPLPKKDMILWEYKKTQRGRLIYWFTPNSKSVMSANLISRRVIGKTMFLCIIDRISQSSLKNCIIKKERIQRKKRNMALFSLIRLFPMIIWITKNCINYIVNYQWFSEL